MIFNLVFLENQLSNDYITTVSKTLLSSASITMPEKLFCILFGLVLAIAVAESALPGRQAREDTIGNHYFFHESLETTANTWKDALTYCKTQGGELAKITNPRLFTILGRMIKADGAYWIDGIRKKTDVKIEPANPPCTKEQIDLSGSDVRLDKLTDTCLKIVRESSPTHSFYIKDQLCTSGEGITGVICSIPLPPLEPCK